MGQGWKLISVPDLPFCLCVLMHMDPLAKNVFYDGVLLMWCNFKFDGVPEHVCLTACVGLPGLPPSGPKSGAS